MGCASSSSTSIVRASDSEKGFFECYALGEKLGKGTFGQVRIATPLASQHNSRREEFAVKIVDLRDQEAPDTLSSTLQESAATEACLWRQVTWCAHNNLVRLQNVFYDDVFCYYVMEKCTSSLFAHLERIAVLDERSLKNILTQMFLAIEHMHLAGVVHRDVKPDNFLIGGTDGATVKLCDFGLSVALPRVGKSDWQLKGLCGTAPFMCPEMIMGKKYDLGVDVWSMGVIAYALLFGAFPYSPIVASSKAMKQAIVDGKPPTFEPVAPCIGQKRSDSAVNFVKTLLERSADQRPSASHALRMPYMLVVRENRHMKGAKLPSLRPMLYAAKKARVFEFPDLFKEDDIDPLLNEKQQESHGVSLLGQTSDKSTLRKQSEAPPISRVWDDNGSSVTTAASANLSLRGTAVPSDCCSSPKLSNDCWSTRSRTDYALNMRGSAVPSDCSSPKLPSDCWSTGSQTNSALGIR